MHSKRQYLRWHVQSQKSKNKSIMQNQTHQMQKELTQSTKQLKQMSEKKKKTLLNQTTISKNIELIEKNANEAKIVNKNIS